MRSNVRAFQSLSGLTLGLNMTDVFVVDVKVRVSIPFRADTGFERATDKRVISCPRSFNPFQG